MTSWTVRAFIFIHSLSLHSQNTDRAVERDTESNPSLQFLTSSDPTFATESISSSPPLPYRSCPLTQTPSFLCNTNIYVFFFFLLIPMLFYSDPFYFSFVWLLKSLGLTEWVYGYSCFGAVN